MAFLRPRFLGVGLSLSGALESALRLDALTAGEVALVSAPPSDDCLSNFLRVPLKRTLKLSLDLEPD